MKLTKGNINSGGKAVITAALVAIAVMAMPSLANAQSNYGERQRAEATDDTNGEQQTRRERRRERLADRRERIRGRVEERRETRREHRSERREAAQQRYDRRRENRQDRYQQWRDTRPTAWRHNNTRQPAYRTPMPRQNYYAWQRQQQIARYQAQQRYWAWQRYQGQRSYSRRPTSNYGYRHRTSAPATNWNFYRH